MAAIQFLGVDWYIALAVILVALFVLVLAITGGGAFRAGRGARDDRR